MVAPMRRAGRPAETGGRPDGYRVEFANEAFTQRNLNGHIHDSALGFYWYMVNLPTGTCRRASTRSRSPRRTVR
ncbi:hypothetical protein [Saccharothrix sp. NRRL B-16348]|uniref:hypothetical protein n=1 Tax=Saccharothrix sp. NRRL B-16348 TaxID=1415542 RepID=UPI000A875206|nr:hypothetical protein [Saccharothrix sp. NRRL B-16348]